MSRGANDPFALDPMRRRPVSRHGPLPYRTAGDGRYPHRDPRECFLRMPITAVARATHGVASGLIGILGADGSPQQRGRKRVDDRLPPANVSDDGQPVEERPQGQALPLANFANSSAISATVEVLVLSAILSANVGL